MTLSLYTLYFLSLLEISFLVENIKTLLHLRRILQYSMMQIFKRLRKLQKCNLQDYLYAKIVVVVVGKVLSRHNHLNLKYLLTLNSQDKYL